MKTEVDSHKLMYHPERVSQFLIEGDCPPIYVEIGVSNTCNHHCKFCALDWVERGTQRISEKILIPSLKDMANLGVKSVMFAGEGEPLTNKETPKFIRAAKSFGMDISLTTNGVLFDKKTIDSCLQDLTWARFSINAGLSRTYAEIHGTSEKDFEKVFDNLLVARETRERRGLKTTLGIQTLLLDQNFEELGELAEKAKNFGADNIQIKPYSPHPKSSLNLSPNYEEILQKVKSLSHLESPTFQILFREKTFDRLQSKMNYHECHGLPFLALIDSFGNVMPCNMHYGKPPFFYGNIHEEKFSEILEGEKRKKVIKKIKEKGIDKCRSGCRLDPINQYLARLKNPHPHENFI